ncbi:Holliday junction resolvase RecU [Sporanaerobium hydrogeniformans]|uniref:Holliday junction resolvase RecU n=1 Tax=Sporanaerobium hydrogeniformans TaxID=3072179 RepID=A0AC61DHW9_9FIRM|nr:Holliday junction resolvase RecU [Sporanaerobium hydrogeniformans]PHV71822.1 Holliday junction resolvase RecU [Sporanaerobium hydrogeniformans]
MGYWNTRGLRGNELEEMINLTNDRYREKQLAIVQKVPTPIKPITIDQKKRVITLAYFDQKSTVDYIGVVQGIPICFDAKETTKNFLPISNIHEHQVTFMRDFKKQGGEAFLIVAFKKYEDYFLLDIETLNQYYERAQTGGRKSMAYEEFNKERLIPVEGGLYLNYLKALEKYLNTQEEV